MDKDGGRKAIHYIKRLVGIFVGLLSLIFLLRAYIKMTKKFIANIVILLVGVISSLFVYKEAKWIRNYLRTVSQKMRDKSKKRKCLKNMEKCHGKDCYTGNWSTFIEGGEIIKK